MELVPTHDPELLPAPELLAAPELVLAPELLVVPELEADPELPWDPELLLELPPLALRFVVSVPHAARASSVIATAAATGRPGGVVRERGGRRSDPFI